jgi:HAD superfamily hydrolase (TIGR01509 family)
MATPAERRDGLIFDCDGVLADTERDGHLPAFNLMFEAEGLPIRWSERDYAKKLQIGGGKERLSSLLTPEFVKYAGLPTSPDEQRKLIARWHRLKTELYTRMVSQGRLPGRPGIARIVDEALDEGWALAVASTSAEVSVRAVLEHVVGPRIAGQFQVFAGDIVPRKKPAPDIYRHAIEKLRLPASRLVVVEDSGNGLAAARAAGLACVVTVNDYTRDDDFTGAALVVSSLGDPGGPPIEVLSDPSGMAPEAWLTVADLEEARDRATAEMTWMRMTSTKTNPDAPRARRSEADHD